MKSPLKAWLIAACAIAGSGCTDTENTQVLTGRVTNANAVAVRAIDGDTIITAARVRTDGSFTLHLPANHRYRLEVMTSGGVHNVVKKTGALADLTFKVCQPTDPFDMGGFGEPGCDPMDPNGKGCGDPWPCDDPMDPGCAPCEPGDANCGWPCDPMADGTCGQCDPTDPWCPDNVCDPMAPWDPDCKCDPADPNCGNGCDPMTDANCGGCDPMDPNCGGGGGCDPMDPTCGCQPGDPNCGPCDPMTDPDCGVCSSDMDPDCKCDWWQGNCQPCDPTLDAMCPTPPPPCADPMDPDTCKDPCVNDPMACGCGMDPGDGTMKGQNSDDGNTCWPPPEQCTMQSCPDDPWAPDNMPPDFGCKDGQP